MWQWKLEMCCSYFFPSGSTVLVFQTFDMWNIQIQTIFLQVTLVKKCNRILTVCVWVVTLKAHQNLGGAPPPPTPMDPPLHLALPDPRGYSVTPSKIRNLKFGTNVEQVKLFLRTSLKYLTVTSWGAIDQNEGEGEMYAVRSKFGSKFWKCMGHGKTPPLGVFACLQWQKEYMLCLNIVSFCSFKSTYCKTKKQKQNKKQVPMELWLVLVNLSINQIFNKTFMYLNPWIVLF